MEIYDLANYVPYVEMIWTINSFLLVDIALQGGKCKTPPHVLLLHISKMLKQHVPHKQTTEMSKIKYFTENILHGNRRSLNQFGYTSDCKIDWLDLADDVSLTAVHWIPLTCEPKICLPQNNQI